ncbi:hypothetical protein [Sunxiuqinia indica]|uniref:hypothetical protein n=1 Tax=Sunxiuqinia indica TaxID=2692584 RepID=UPI001358AA1D|nr:hypothetical protein [Sunxiuqinia indica]
MPEELIIKNPITQTRPYELPLYIQYGEGDPEYVDPDNIFLMVDYVDWSKPKRFSLGELLAGAGGLGGGIHIEKGRLTGLTDHYVAVDFEFAFDDIPIGRGNLNVYKVRTHGDGNTTDIKYTPLNLDVSTEGFSFYIDESIDLTGIIVEYIFL